MAYRFFNPVEQFFDGAGALLSGGKLFFYEPSTLTLRTTYSDEALTTANTNPIVLNSAGRPAVDTWLSGSYRIILKDANDITIWDRDPYREPATATNVQNSDSTWGGTAGGSANALTITLSPAISAYTAGLEFEFIAASNNTGAATLNVNGKGAIAITKDGTTALVANDLKTNQVVKVKYDGTRFQIVSPNSMLLANGGNARARADVASAATVDLDAINGFYARITGTTTITAITLADGKWLDVVFGGALTLTNGASLILEGGANIITVAGDTCRVHGEAAGVVRIKDYRRGAVKPTEGTGGRLTATRYYTAGDTWTKPANLDFVIVEGIGGGGGGGNALGNDTCGGGGGGGGYSKKKVSAASLGATETVTIGAGGSGGGPGGTGGTTSFGAHITASGGVGGAATGGNGGAGGSGSSGDLNIKGGSGARGLTLAGASGGIGGNTVQGGGGGGGAPDANGSIGGNYGGGGGGAARVVSSRTGGTGAAGLVIVYEYSP